MPNVLTVLCRRIATRIARRCAAAPPSVAGTAPGSDDDGLPTGCAWFESSHDLRQGLRVFELAEDHATAA